ncbi:hypothetical protein HX13_17870 [Chryseobacterium sp. P1-3]|nr:hypothetical protein HX13_17870 [Chryseobacterium sp. P1-3]
MTKTSIAIQVDKKSKTEFIKLIFYLFLIPDLHTGTASTKNGLAGNVVHKKVLKKYRFCKMKGKTMKTDKADLDNSYLHSLLFLKFDLHCY